MFAGNQLLRDYADRRDEQAFCQLVEHYVNLVYSTALRQMGGDAHAAQDITQVVFTNLARKARSLSSNVMLGGWLYRDTVFTAARLRRSEGRRQMREQEAARRQVCNSDETAWRELEPLIGEAMTRLPTNDCDVLTLRFFEGQTLQSVGAAIGISEDAARMRVERALEKLRHFLAKRGITSTISATTMALTAGTLIPAPATLAASVTKSALAGAGTGTWGILSSLKPRMTTHAAASVVGAIVIIGLIVSLLFQNGQRRNGNSAAISQPSVAPRNAYPPVSFSVEGRVSFKDPAVRDPVTVTLTVPAKSGETGRLSFVRQRVSAIAEVSPRMRGADIEYRARFVLQDEGELRPASRSNVWANEMSAEQIISDGGLKSFSMTNRLGGVVTWRLRLTRKVTST